MDSLIRFPTTWKDYELIDTGDGEKLERFGTYVISRPDSRVLWKKSAVTVWKEAHAAFKEVWQIKKEPPQEWKISYKDLVFILKPTSFKHVGVFPEQAVNWDFLKEKSQKGAKILNLFGYTGGATLAAVSAGAHVTHVDSSRPSISWARENAAASRLANKPIRWIEDDAYKFVLRETRRNILYDAIIMDPPRFGRGSKGEVWKLEENLPRLLTACKQILSPDPLFVLINAYTADLSPIVLKNLMADFIGKPGIINAGELALKDSYEKLLPSGIFATYARP